MAGLSTGLGALPLLLPREGELQCQSASASDYYGLGVRLGIYFAWLGGYVANVALPAEFGPASDTNTIFLLTLLVAMANEARSGTLGQIDGLVLMHLCGGTVFGILSLWGYRTSLYRDRGPRAISLFGGFGTHVKLIVSLGVSIFGFWFWLYGIAGALRPMGPDDGSDPPNSPECGTLYTFYFAKVRADSGIRIYYIIICVSCIVWFGIMFLASSIGGWVSFERALDLLHFHHWAKTNRSNYVTGFTHNELCIIFKFLRILNLIWLILSALTVEFTLNFNHVHGVLGGEGASGGLQLPGQLLPFLVGLFSFVRICYRLYQAKRGRTGMEPGDGTDPMDEAAAPAAPGTERTDSWGGEPQKQWPWPVRYLVAWLPWLGLVMKSPARSRISTMIREGTGLSKYSQAEEKRTDAGP